MTDAISRDVAHSGSSATAARDAVASRQGSTSGDVPALLLGAVFDQLPHGVVVQDATGRLQAANRAARDLLGIDPEAIRASTPALRLRVVDERGAPLADDEHPSLVALRTGRPVHERLLGVVGPDTDETRWMRVSAHPHRAAGDASGPAESVLTFFTDVTEEVESARAAARQVIEIRAEVERRTRAEESLRAANHDLAMQREQLQEQAVELEMSNQQLQEQQIELETINEQLQENAAELEAQADELQVATEHLSRQAEELDRARRRAEEANAAKSQFLAAMSHELRTPLNAITGYVDLISMGIRGGVTEAQQEDLSRIKRSGDHLLRLINDILQFAKLEAGQLQFRLVDVPLDAALRELEALVQPQMRARRLSFGFSVSAEHPVARADRDKMQQIVLNLLSNAIKATEPGGSVRVEASTSEAERCAIVRVSDTGIGIPGEKLATIFDPFVQVDRQLNRPGEGIGLGLAISRDLARSMGGDLTVESTPGRGSTFTLSLPLA
jgi:signal transduction histidine kinase